MNSIAIPLVDVVLIGGGHSHVHVIKMMGMSPIEGVRFTLITKDTESPYSGMIPGFVAGYYTRDECHIDLRRLCSFAGVDLIQTAVNRLDTDLKLIYCNDGRPPISYDLLSINTGIVPRPLSVAFENNFSTASITPVKPIDGFAFRWDQMRTRVLETTTERLFRIVVVGGGAGGVELACAIHHRLTQELNACVDTAKKVTIEVSILNKGSEIMRGHNKSVRSIIFRLLSEKGVAVHCDAEVCGVQQTAAGGQELKTSDDRLFPFDEVIWCTEGVAQSWLRESGLQCDEVTGCVSVQATLESVNTPGVFASGDVCHNTVHPRAKAGVFAVRAGPPLVDNIRRLLFKEPLNEWTPQEEFLGLIGTGDRYAVASKGGLGVEGAYLWTLKDSIDRRWMAGYSTLLPTMEEMAQKKLISSSSTSTTGATVSGGDVKKINAATGKEAIELLSKSKMRCGGCGSKVGAQVLSRALSRVRGLLYRDRPEVLAGIGMHTGDDAAIVTPPAPPSLLVHSIDYFRNFVSDPYLFGQIAANHALSDVHAMNGEPISALALCVVPYGPERKVENHLVQLLAGVLKVLSSERCALVGGHTSEGAEAALGLSVTGTVHPDRVFHKGPLPRGSVLVLTKALGTGAIMAADMRARAKGAWVSSAMTSMLQSNRDAASILHAHGCTACTDVTGFGFLGHLIEMIQYGEQEEEVNQGSGDSSEEKEVKSARHTEDNNDSKSVELLTSVDLFVNSVPLLHGAAECVSLGIMSSLHPQNIRCARAVGNVETGRGIPAYPLLFDPQTSGGLLAAVPEENATALIVSLKAAGFEASTVVGRVVKRETTLFAPLVNLVL